MATLTAHTIRTTKMGIDFSSLVEYLKSEGFENTLSQRLLDDIPLSSYASIIIIKNEERVLFLTEVSFDETGQRKYKIQQVDGLSIWLTQSELSEKYLGYCWFIKLRITEDVRSELPEYTMPKAWFFKVIWRFKKYYYQIILATFCY